MRTIPLTAALLLAACGEKTGQVEVRAWAEEGVPDGFPAAETDGWDVSFDHWITVLAKPSLTDPADGTELETAVASFALDWKDATEPVPFATLTVPAGRAQFGFQIVPASDATAPIGDVDDALLQAMVSEGYSHWVAGSATKDGATLSFELGFNLDVVYENCENGADGSEGIAVNAGEVTPADIYVHADHLLWDQLGTEEAGLAFQAWADADANADLNITADELAAVDIASIGYEAAGIDVDNLWEFVGYSVALMAHLNGEGECLARGYEE